MFTPEINKQDDQIVETAVKLSLVEVILGSLLHSFFIPLAGHFLSLNQGYFLCRALTPQMRRGEAFKSITEISFVTACMKALAPTNKKLGPMISISAQGILFGLGTLLFGANLTGQIFGMILLSLWAFIQPFITYFLIFGTDLVGAFFYYSNLLKETWELDMNTIYLFAISIIFLKFFVAIMITLLNHYHYLKKWNKALDSFKIKDSKPKVLRTLWSGLLYDLTRPLFLVSLIFMASFFYFNKTDNAFILWKISRSLAIAFLLFFLARSPFFHRFINKMASKSRFINRIQNLSRMAYSKLQNLN